MVVPQKRNEKKTRRRPKQLYRARSPQGIRLDNKPYYSKDGHPLSLEEKPSFEEWLRDTEPVDTIEEMVNNPERLLRQPDACDPDDDTGSDLDDLYEDY